MFDSEMLVGIKRIAVSAASADSEHGFPIFRDGSPG